jgi:hypothetical protein
MVPHGAQRPIVPAFIGEALAEIVKYGDELEEENLLAYDKLKDEFESIKRSMDLGSF